MDREWRNRINEDIEGFRKALVHYAKACEWDTFEKKAGALFDYLESVERRHWRKNSSGYSGSFSPLSPLPWFSLRNWTALPSRLSSNSRMRSFWLRSQPPVLNYFSF